MFKKRTANKNIRKRETDSSSDSETKVKKKASTKIKSETKALSSQANANYAGGITNALSAKDSATRAAIPTEEIIKKSVNETTDGTDGLYKGISGYKTWMPSKELTNSKLNIGPIKAPNNVRITSRFDYAPDICKDYKDTGYCGFGDNCKFLHDRSDYKAGWMLDLEWDKKQKELKKIETEGDSDGDVEEVEDAEEAETHCPICLNEFDSPVETKCMHVFCEKCVLKRFIENANCFVCDEPTDGIFKPFKPKSK